LLAAFGLFAGIQTLRVGQSRSVILRFLFPLFHFNAIEGCRL
jgi:hypothetical protein